MPNLQYEQTALEQWGVMHVAGLDEAGRGSIAGPVVAAAVMLPLDEPDLLGRLAGVDDSKRLNEHRREALQELILETALTSSVGSSSAKEIDDHGIIAATKLAMRRALEQLQPAAQFLLIDGRLRLSRVNLPQQSIIRGDSASLSIAAASILAKVSRDREMRRQDERYPHYGFTRHKGYGTPEHMAALAVYGPCPLHRRSFAPLRGSLF